MSKVKVLIEIEEGEYEHIKNSCFDYWSAEEVHNAIANGTVITDDCISRSALKQKASHYIVRSTEDGHNWNELCVTVDQIDDAPPYGKENEK